VILGLVVCLVIGFTMREQLEGVKDEKESRRPRILVP
jgi:hypothetical protein